MKATIEQLTRVSIFANLLPEQLAQLQPDATMQQYQAGETITQEGDSLPAALYALVDGRLRVVKTATTGKETILRTLNTGDIFAAPALFGNQIAPATVIAEDSVQVLTVKREALLKAIQANPEIALQMMAVFNQRLQQLHDIVHGLVSERAIVRLARLIQTTAIEQHIDLDRPGADVELQSHYHIARRIGITYEECVRLFKQLQGVVSYRRGGKITVIDGAALNQMAHGSADL
ncbi:Crp/Fnr family transcriptional regulator [Leptolyngbya sp. FACHB-17]|uniref:Crp/Fnr family transcriptional regulator n=1 Tax=unclassified Leptolyngbya TaxID=2650499 RepID=UPI001680CE42|nr:Crp/Fnr family transcriptional regulator [Leptolyngbya sp. FACHB-17]MBD2078683.1 Crp/Fnr family transcriptional regulator [Leptolyngbya sp. FACHB-17]